VNNCKVLICDDDPGILDMLELVLSGEGYEVIPESNSLRVAGVIKDKRPEIVLLDLWMPVLSGDQVLRNLRQNESTADIPVIVFSASTDGRMIAMEAGASDFVSKPFDLDLLINKIQFNLTNKKGAA
jgi:DNA-binding response OmpR family regulator